MDKIFSDRDDNPKEGEEFNNCVKSPTCETNYLDLSNGLEKSPIFFNNKLKTKLLRTKYNFERDYITKSFLKNGEIDDYLLTKDYSCKCLDECDKTICDCVVNHAQLYECNKYCLCDINCGNRQVQKGVCVKLKVDWINKTKGFGVFAREDIKKGDFVCEYVGKVINKATAEDKIKDNLRRKKPNYVLQIRENYESITISTFIDAEEKGNVSRFLNHSCNPNLFFDVVRVDHFIPGLAFFASRDIKCGEELSFSYGEISEHNLSTYEASYKECLCGSEVCKKFLPS